MERMPRRSQLLLLPAGIGEMSDDPIVIPLSTATSPEEKAAQDRAMAASYRPIPDGAACAADPTVSDNARVAARYDELMREGKHGHYETLFLVCREERERVALDLLAKVQRAFANMADRRQ